MEIAGDRLSYHGTGGEILRGWLKAAVVFFIPYMLVSNGPRWMGAGPGLIAVGVLSSFLLILLFIPMATIGSRRYRLSRTAWRGIRFSFQGTWRDYMGIYVKGSLLTAITLGLYTPYYEAKREKFLLSNTFIGDKNFDYDGKGDDLFKSYLACLLFAIPTLTFSLLWYHVKRTRCIWDHTCFGGARFDCSITFGGMLMMSLVNMLLVLFTLGFGFSWAQVRAINYLTNNLTLDGPVDLDAIQQDHQTVNATGEELASFMELDFDLG